MAYHQVCPQVSMSSPLTSIDIEKIKTLAYDSFLLSMLEWKTSPLIVLMAFA